MAIGAFTGGLVVMVVTVGPASVELLVGADVGAVGDAAAGDAASKL